MFLTCSLLLTCIVVLCVRFLVIDKRAARTNEWRYSVGWRSGWSQPVLCPSFASDDESN